MPEGLDGTCLNEAGSCQFGVNQADSQQHAPKYNSCSLEDYHRRDAANESLYITQMRYEHTSGTVDLETETGFQGVGQGGWDLRVLPLLVKEATDEKLTFSEPTE